MGWAMAAPAIDAVTYRILPSDEWDKLLPFCPDPATLPAPGIATAVVAERDTKVVGCAFLQLVIHLEPIAIEEHAASYREMCAVLISQLPAGTPFMSCVPDAKMAHIATEIGMQPTGWSIYKGGA
jgi:hypothetical protein